MGLTLKFSLILMGLLSSGYGSLLQADASLSDDTSIGTNYFNTELSYDGDTHSSKDKPSDHKRVYNWELTYTYTSNQVTDPATNLSSTDKSNEWTGLFGVEFSSHIELGGGLQFSNTPAEDLTSFGPNAYLGYTYHIKHPAPASKDDFLQGSENPKIMAAIKEDDDDAPADSTLGVKETLMNLGYTQKFVCNSSTCPSHPGLDSNSIHQFSIETQINWSPWEWFSSKFSYTSYTYDRDVSAFLQYLSNHQVVSSLLSGLATTIGGLPLEQYEADLVFYFLENWEIEPIVDIIPSAVSGNGTVETYKGTLSRSIGKLKLGLGFEKDVSPTLTNNLLLINFKYNL